MGGNRHRPALGLWGLFALVGPVMATEAPRPHIVVILADDLGFSDLGSYGGEIHTPNLDALASGGVRFTQFYTTPRCSPTRASLLTGLYPHEVGVGHLNLDWKHPGYRGELGRRAPTLPELLREAGYTSYMAGKWHLAHNPDLTDASPGAEETANWPLKRGFERFYGTIRGSGSFWHPSSLVRDHRLIEPGDDYYYTEAISREAVGFLSRHLEERPGEPFFLYLAYTAPHWPLHARRRDIAKYAQRYDAGWDALREERYRRMQELGILDRRWPLSPRDPHVPAWEEVPHKEWEARRMEVYAAMTDAMDQGIGQVTEALRTGGVLDDTLILFFSDNGGNGEELRGISRLGKYFMPLPDRSRAGSPLRFGSHPQVMPGPEDTFQAYGQGWSNLSNTPFRQHKHFAHEGGISTPFIAHWPAGRVKPGGLNRWPGHVVDILPTLLEVAGVSYPAEFAGRPALPLRGTSLLPVLQGHEVLRGPLFWEHEGNRAVRQGRWKLVADWPGGWELYDMEADRTELHDLAPRHPERVAALATLYETYARSAQVGRWPLVVPYVPTLLGLTAAAVLGGLIYGLRRWSRAKNLGPRKESS